MARKKLSKSDKIRKLLDKGVDRNQIVKDLGVSPQLVYIVAKKGGFVKKKAKKKSKIIRAVTQMQQKLDAIKKGKENWENTRVFWRGMKAQYGNTTSEVMDQLVDPKPIFGEVTIDDPVNHPPHYRAGGIETIDFIESKDLNYRLGNVVKYVSRAGRKLDANPVEDLEKAAWYLNREIEARRNA